MISPCIRSARSPRWKLGLAAVGLLINLFLVALYYRQPKQPVSVTISLAAEAQYTSYHVIEVQAHVHDEITRTNQHQENIDVDSYEYYQKSQQLYQHQNGEDARINFEDDLEWNKEETEDKRNNYQGAMQIKSGAHYNAVPTSQQRLILANVPKKFDYHLYPKSDLCKEKPFLLILVCSAVQKLDLRDAIRNTWGSVEQRRPLATELVFILGNFDDQHEHLRTVVENEMRTYSDILQVDYEDSYRTLSIKSLAAFSWATSYCSGATFVMKTDDDVFINLRNLIRDLTPRVQTPPKNFIVGHVIEGAKPIKNRSEKWYMPDGLFKDVVYPNYLSGTAYVMPLPLVPYILETSQNKAFFWLEDVYITGILAKEINANLLDHDKFLYKRLPGMNPCDYISIIASHEMAAPDLYQVWKDILRHRLDCNDGLHMNGNVMH